MKATTVATLLAFLGCAICQLSDFPSSSRTWTNQGSNERLINITGVEPLKYSFGNILLAVHIGAGSGVVYYGVGDRKYNFTTSGSSVIYEMAVPFCILDGLTNEIRYFVHFESTLDLSYKVTLTQSSTELPNNEARIVNLVPPLFKNLPFLISTGDKEVTKTIEISIAAAVPLDGFMGQAVIEARQKCASESLQLQSFPVVAKNTTWTFTAQFDAGYENYTVTFVPSKEQSMFSTFYITASVKLGANISAPDSDYQTDYPTENPCLGKWLYLIIGGAAVVVIVAAIAVFALTRRPKGYVRIQPNYYGKLIELLKF